MSTPTAREIQVLAAVFRCGGAKCAAAELGLTPQTVETHVSRVLRKLHVESRDQAAIALGWLTIPILMDSR
jgi:DNA-binding NarL/FixJ family response regulator